MKQIQIKYCLLFLLVLVPQGMTESPSDAPWPMLHRDLVRSGYVEELPQGPYERLWYRDFHDEMIATRIEAIVAQGLVFVGTFAGNLYALDGESGETRWTFEADGPFLASPSYHDGVIYIGCDNGYLYAVDATTGESLWSFEAKAGFSTPPAVTGGLILIGDRNGVFYAIDKETHTPRWTYQASAMILSPASVKNDRVVFGAEDMVVRCLRTENGDILWENKVDGVSLRDYAPTICEDIVIVRSNPSGGFHEVLDPNQRFLLEVQGLELENWRNFRRPVEGAEDNELRKGYGFLPETPEAIEKEQTAVIQNLKENPHYRSFHAFRLSDGDIPWIAPVFYLGGLFNPATPPTFNPETGELYTFFRSALTNYDMRGEVRPLTHVGKVDLNTGKITPLPHSEGNKMPWGKFECIGDETESLSLAGNGLICTHQGIVGYLDLNDRTLNHIAGKRDTYGGIFGPAVAGGWDAAREAHQRGELVYMTNEWHGPARGIVAIAYDRFYWVVGSHVIAIGKKPS